MSINGSQTLQTRLQPPIRVNRSIRKTVRFRKPKEEDGAEVWKLIREAGVLDLNSPYSYLMLCKFFPETCVIAETQGNIVGFVSAFLPQTAEETVFVWQVAVHPSQRGKGLGKALLKELLSRNACSDVRYLEATVSPSNRPSQSLFKGLAKELGTDCKIFECFPENLFPNPGHESEWTYRIGPYLPKEKTEEVQ
ncbi:diaminobutyrate acetyltransferase [Kroppenstedtia eburnea]|uniref:L-2,4-diaminobutyric acid acetyltransferase n=1 Tax=Kroppenstedtia eburnea TaxID=714067 RepID=A0A1N7KNX8_9BACL|nr:diaminobutyrate acetyltransferase [Kroppenstedtia eburnea]QKI82886.1 diaminobutyrate acetyltransferase [Kroppenstedtia eburnea]SIS63196.1 diaminobutyrate acetyltransferase [Kroppenstedtia eburnea]